MTMVKVANGFQISPILFMLFAMFRGGVGGGKVRAFGFSYALLFTSLRLMYHAILTLVQNYASYLLDHIQNIGKTFSPRPFNVIQSRYVNTDTLVHSIFPPE